MFVADINKHREMLSEVKSNKKAWREPENPILWAFCKEMREHNKTKKIYDINPYAEVYQFRDNLYGIYTESLDGMGDPWIYLTVGPEKAMVIDTGFGVGNLRGLVNEISGGKPLIVANTHAHYDHSYGNCQFDRVYCHEYEVPYLKREQTSTLWDYLFDENGNGNWADFDREDIIPYREYEIVGVPDGFEFDLGEGHIIELIFLPGHKPGHAAFLDRKNRVLFAGDAACIGSVDVGGGRPGEPYSEYGCVTAYMKQLQKIIDRADEFDGVFPGHGLVDMSSDVLRYIMNACEHIIAEPCRKETEITYTRFGRLRTEYREPIFLSGFVRYTRDTI